MERPTRVSPNQSREASASGGRKRGSDEGECSGPGPRTAERRNRAVSETAQPQPAPPASQGSPRCAACGYDLHGLSGDPIRCPECGALTGRSPGTIRQLQLRAAEFRARQRRIEVGPNLCAIAIGAAAALFGLLISALSEFFWAIYPLMYGACLLIWIAGFSLVFLQCRKFPGWLGAFLRHQVYGVLAALGNWLLIFGLFAAGLVLFAGADTPACMILFVLGGAAVLFLWVRPMRWFARRATAELDPLVRASLENDEPGTES